MLVVAGLVLLLAAAIAGYLTWRGYGAGTAPAPVFQVLLIKPGSFYAEMAAEAAEAGGKVPPEAIDVTADALDLPLADVMTHPAGKDFRALLARLPSLAAVLSKAIVFRVRDGERITDDGGDALAGANSSVIVVPNDIAMMYGDDRTAFIQIRMRISGLQ
jgi:hypothetical protein